MLRPSKAWHSSLTALGVTPSAADELLTSTHWHLYAQVPMKDGGVFDTVITQELGEEDPRVPGAYTAAAGSFAHALVAHLSRELASH